LIRFFSSVLVALFVLTTAVARAMPVETVTVVTASGKTEFETEIATTEEERSVGLMFRRHLAPDKAMLFDFGKPRRASMWMKNTYIPLDMIFISADGTVEGVIAAKPHSTAVVTVDAPVKAVLEVIAGTAKRIGLKKGDRVIHRIFEAKP
jgi:hypothetical protein